MFPHNGMTEAMKLQKYSIKYELERESFCIFLLIVKINVKRHENPNPVLNFIFLLLQADFICSAF